ncbi:MAG: ABC transporter permease subunit [Planctomycetia bacterium]|nr:ABC transporter permease subunit [Planctomycetia bacterium]
MSQPPGQHLDFRELVERGEPRQIAKRVRLDRGFYLMCMAITMIAVIALLVLLGSILINGIPGLSWSFVTNFTSRDPGKAGILAPLAGSIWISAICAVVALPVGVATALYLEEFAARNRFTNLLRLNISNLAGVPSIVYGILGLTLFVRMFGLAGTTQDPALEIGGETYAMYYDVTGEPLRVPVENRSVTPTLETGTIAYMQRVLDGPDGELIFTDHWEPIPLTIVEDSANAPLANGVIPAVDAGLPVDYEVEKPWYYVQFPFGQTVLAGGLTLMLVVLPIVIISSQEAIRSVPGSLRSGSFAMGATRLQTVSRVTLPASIPMIMTGAILAMSRAIGEAAPILVLGVALFITDVPQTLMDPFTVLPMQIYNWSARFQPEFRALAASGIIVLLFVLLAFNAIAITIRQRFSRPLQ